MPVLNRRCILVMLLVLDVMSSAADSALGLDVACLSKRNLGKEGTEDLIDKNGKEGDQLTIRARHQKCIPCQYHSIH